MKILHFSDVHIGVENYSRTDPETGLSTRLVDFLRTLDEVVSYALDNGVDLVLFCGDAYKSRDPSQTHQREFAKRIASLSAAGIPVFLLSGNHDMPHITSRATALEIFRTLDVENVHTADRLDTYRVSTGDGPVQIVALPWIRRSGLLASDETRRLSPDEVNGVIQRKLTDAIRAQAQALDKSVPAILAGHITISEAVASSEQSMLLGREHFLTKSSVALPELDYVALGHIHKHQTLGRDPLVVYSGSLQRINFGEEGEDKGFCVIELDPSKPTGLRVSDFEFEKVDAREFLTITATVQAGDTDPTGAVIKVISNYHVQEAIVRVLIKLDQPDGGLQDVEIRHALEGAHFVASISKEVKQTTRTRLGEAYERDLGPLDTLKLYLESRKVGADRAEVLMRHARSLVEDEVE